MTRIANQIATAPLRKRKMLKPRIVPHVISIMVVSGSVVMIPRIVSAKVHTGSIERLHDQTSTIDAYTRRTRIIPSIRSSQIIVCTANRSFYAIVFRSVETNT